MSQLKQTSEANYQTIHGTGIEQRKPLRVAFSPLEKVPQTQVRLETDPTCQQADSVASGGAIQEDIKEEDEDEDDEDDKNDDVFGPEKQALTNGPAEEGETWDSKITFMLATIGYAVGLGNVWRLGREKED